MKYVLADDYSLLRQRIDQLQKDIFALGEEFHEAVNQSSETWHDNAPFDVVRDKQTLLNVELQSLRSLIRELRTVSPEAGDSVTIGSRVLLSGPKELKVVVAGHWTGRETVDGHMVVRYDAPFTKCILDKKVGDKVDLPTGIYRITTIE